mgnify:CR=1 FL=1
MNGDVAYVNFHKVVDQEHPDHAVHIDAGVGLIGKDQRVKGKVPAVFA